ncbi:MAG: MarR family transcriptional regulator [Methanomethylophilus sp.]|nr:hypothetical protein [Methanomethylophilus sp.]MDD4668304.1 hypothetical protein [Methanomethylophilus sp.]
MSEESRVMVSPHIMKSYMRNRTEAVLSTYGLNPGDGPFLMEIGDCGGMSLKELSTEMMVDRGLTTRTVSRLLAGDFIENRSLDRRIYRVWLTPRGTEVREALLKTFKQTKEELTANFTSEEKAELIRLMHKMLLNIRQSATPGSRS